MMVMVMPISIVLLAVARAPGNDSEGNNTYVDEVMRQYFMFSFPVEFRAGMHHFEMYLCEGFLSLFVCLFRYVRLYVCIGRCQLWMFMCVYGLLSTNC